MAKLRRIFPGGNTSKGFYSLHDNIIGPNKKMLYILKGMPGGGKSSMMREIGERALREGYSVEFHHCPSDATSIDGIVIEELKIGLIDGTPPHSVDPTYPGLTEKIIDLGKFIDSDILELYKEEIMKAKINNKYAYRKAFNYFKSGKIIHDEIQECNKTNVDFSKVNSKTREVIDKIFSQKMIIIEPKGFKTRNLFSNAYTPDGYVDYTESIMEGIKYIYYLKGEIGTGKSTLLNRIVEEAKTRNLYLEIFYNSILPDKIESILIPELDTVISSNINASKNNDEVIDLNDFFDTDKINTEDYNVYYSLINKGIEGLKGAKENHYILENSYKKAVNYQGVTETREKIWLEIKNMMKG